MSQTKVKLTANIDRSLYESVTKNFHHGQLSAFHRKVFQALDKKIREGNILEIIEFIYKDKPLTLGD